MCVCVLASWKSSMCCYTRPLVTHAYVLSCVCARVRTCAWVWVCAWWLLLVSGYVWYGSWGPLGLGPLRMNNASDRAVASQQHCLGLLKVASSSLGKSASLCEPLQQLGWSLALKTDFLKKLLQQFHIKSFHYLSKTPPFFMSQWESKSLQQQPQLTLFKD